jgi:hypothetical protein
MHAATVLLTLFAGQSGPKPPQALSKAVVGMRQGGKVSALVRARYSETKCLVVIGLARTIYIRCIYGIFGREFTKYTVIYGVHIRLWPTLCFYQKM